MDSLHKLFKPSRRAVLLGGGAMVLAQTVDGLRRPVPSGVVNEQQAWQRIHRVTDRRNVGGYVGFDPDDVELILGGGPVRAAEGVGVGDTRAADAVEQALDRYQLNFTGPMTAMTDALLIIAAPLDRWYSMESHRAFALFLRACAPSRPSRGGGGGGGGRCGSSGIYALGVYRDAAPKDLFRVTLISAAADRER